MTENNDGSTATSNSSYHTIPEHRAFEGHDPSLCAICPRIPESQPCSFSLPHLVMMMNDEKNTMMKSLKDRIDNLINYHTILEDIVQSVDSAYEINEESDMYGFCHCHYKAQSPPQHSEEELKKMGLRNHTVPSQMNLSEHLRHDENWHNPSSTSLMQLAYKIDDPYMRLGTGGSVSKTIQYLDIRRQQQEMFSHRLLKEGLRDLDRLHLSDSITKLSESIDYNEGNAMAWMARAQARYMLRDMSYARHDLLKALSIDSSLAIEHEGLQQLYDDELQQRKKKEEEEWSSLLGKRRGGGGLEDRNELIHKVELSLQRSEEEGEEEVGSTSHSEEEDDSKSRSTHKRKRTRRSRSHHSSHKKSSKHKHSKQHKERSHHKASKDKDKDRRHH